MLRRMLGMIRLNCGPYRTDMGSAAVERVITTRQDRYVQVNVHVDRSMIVLRWKGYAPSAEFRAILEDALANVRLHHVRGWLADLREMNAILRQDEQWAAGDWFPRAAKAGLERMALLTSADYFNQMSVDRIMEAAVPELPFPVAYFDDLEAAKAWLAADREAL
jgi:SpoIIAA-like